MDDSTIAAVAGNSLFAPPEQELAESKHSTKAIHAKRASDSDNSEDYDKISPEERGPGVVVDPSIAGPGSGFKSADPTQPDIPAAKETPDRIKDLHTTAEHAPAVSKGDPTRAVDPETEDLGWSSDPYIPNPIIFGMKNEDSWKLIRRFNKQVYHVHTIEGIPPANIDMNNADKQEFSPDKLRSSFERAYMTMFIGGASVLKHMGRLRNWHEKTRTGIFCAVYFTAWIFNYVMPLFFLVLISLIASPLARKIMFPPLPGGLAATSAKTGTVQQPKAGHLGTKNSLTGASEAYKGEAVEQEASNFVTGITSIAVAGATGVGEPSAEDSETDEKRPNIARGDSATPHPDDNFGLSLKEAKESAAGDAKEGAKKDKTKQPMQEAIWARASPAMHIFDDIVDTYERFGNALSPVPPFTRIVRLKLAGVVVPGLLVSLFLNETMVYKSVTFGIGFGFFGQPLFDLIKVSFIVEWLDTHIPDWKSYLQLRNTILYGVPTNAQLTVTLLRIGEAHQAPLPPPPPVDAPIPKSEDKPKPHETLADAPDNLNDDEVRAVAAHEAAAIDHHEATGGHAQSAEDEKKANEKHKKGSWLLGFIKGTTKAGVVTVLGADRIKAKVGSEHSKTRVGVLTGKAKKVGDGPSLFRCRQHGKKGFVGISTTATTPCVSFELDNFKANLTNDPTPVWSIQIDDIVDIRKIAGLGWKSKLVVGWALNEEVADGLEITDKTGKTHKLTAVIRRDEVFNRLISIGKQKWESL